MGRTRNWRLPLIVLGVCTLVVLVIARNPLLRGLTALQAPQVAAGTWLAEHVGGLFQTSRLLERIRTLEAERDALALKQATLEELSDEHARLQQLVGYIQRTHVRVASAPIIFRDAEEISQSFVLGIGSQDGVHPGLPVITGDGVFLGKVTSVTDVTSTVATLNAVNAKTAITLLNHTRTIGLAESGSGSLLTVRFIPHDETVSVNDLIVTSGLESGIPAGLLVGIVNAVRNTSTDPFQEAAVEPLADARRLRQATVILDANQ